MLLIGCAILLRHFLNPYLGSQAPLLLLTLPVILSAVLWGFNTGILATLVCTIAGSYLYVSADSIRLLDFSIADRIRILIFISIGLTVSIVGERTIKMRNELFQSARLKDKFLAILGHELRNPLAAIKSATEILKLAPNEPNRVERAQQIIDRQVVQMSRMADDLLDLSRIIRGQMSMTFSTVNLIKTLYESIEQVFEKSEKRKQKIIFGYDGGDIKINGDHDRLVQVFTNLLVNAIKFTPIGGIITIKIIRENNKVVVLVADNGVGLEQSLIPNMFKPFVQADGASEKPEGGLGLGLAIVKNIIDLHGGTIRADSAGIGKGSTFSICLPMRLSFV
jgi:signal transduction histidine kinase